MRDIQIKLIYSGLTSKAYVHSSSQETPLLSLISKVASSARCKMAVMEFILANLLRSLCVIFLIALMCQQSGTHGLSLFIWCGNFVFPPSCLAPYACIYTGMGWAYACIDTGNDLFSLKHHLLFFDWLELWRISK